MKYTTFIFMIVVLTQVTRAQTIVRASDINGLGWLEGTWMRTNLKPGRTGSENWVKKSATEWHGLGFTLQDKDTLFVERMKLVIFEDTPAFVADVPENKGLVYFKFTAIDDHTFTCENPAHDYPKKIVYTRQGNALKVTISGNGKSSDFQFERK